MSRLRRSKRRVGELLDQRSASGLPGRRSLDYFADRPRFRQARSRTDHPPLRRAPRSLRRTRRQPAVACLPVCPHHGGRRGQALDPGRHSDDDWASARAGREIRRRGDRDAPPACARPHEGRRPYLYFVRHGCARSGVCPRHFASRAGRECRCREAIAHLHAITGKIAGADIVEFNPAQDNTQITATVAAKLLKEILGKMILN